jgi:hypothetical protein
MKKSRGAWFGLALTAATLLGALAILRPVPTVEAHAGDTFEFSSATYSTIEGNVVQIRVNRVLVSGTASDHTNVNVVLSNGTALHGTHFLGPGGSTNVGLFFPAGSSSQTFEVDTFDDSPSMTDRTFNVAIGTISDSGVAGDPAAAVVTIEDDDGPQPATITSISPTNGTTAGGTVVTIFGSGFTGTDCVGPDVAVTFGGTDATSCTVNGNTSITATTPGHTAGLAEVVVDNGNGASGASPSTANDFTYITPGAPAITSLSVQSGNTGTTVTITGVNLTPSPVVKFGTVTATIVGTPTSNSITVTAPDPGTATRPHLVDVSVTVGAQTSGNTAADDFTYANISVTSLSPSSGPPGIQVDIFGTGFSGSPTVMFGGVAATGVQVISPTQIRATAPVPDSTTRPLVRDVIVTIGGTSSANTAADNFTYSGVSITGISPSAGPAGTIVEITGTGFTSTPTVKFGTVTATVNSFTPTKIFAVAPAQAAGTTTVNVSVTVGTDTSPDAGTADNYTYGGGVTVTDVEPNRGSTAGGNQVVITGTGFVAGGVTTVTFGGTAATSVTRVSDTELRVVAPAHAEGVVAVRVTVNGLQSPDTEADNYTYADIPIVTSIAPNSGASGATTIVTIRGSNFVEGSIVKFGAIEAVRTIISDTEIRAVAPNTAPPGTVDVTVTNAAGTSTTGAHTVFTFTGQGGTPSVLGLSPNSAPLNTSGVEVTITGVNFATPATVKFGTESATNVQVLSSTQIKATAPLRATAGMVDVTVTTPGGTSSTAGTGNDFTYGTASSGATTAYQLFVKFTLITWAGVNNMPVGDALRGMENPDNPSTNNVNNTVTAVFFHSANGAGCPSGQSTCWLAYFPAGVGVPGANNLLVLLRGTAYWVAVAFNVTWTVLTGQ